METLQESRDLGKEIKVFYKNYRGESAWRTIVPKNIFFGETDYHPSKQWLLEVYDKEKNANRIYAMKDILEWQY